MNPNKEKLPNFRNIKTAKDYEEFHLGLKAQKELDDYVFTRLVKFLVLSFLVVFVIFALIATIFMFMNSAVFRDNIGQIIASNIVSAVIILAGYIGISYKNKSDRKKNESLE